MIGFAVCGSFCTHKKSLKVLEKLCLTHDVLPIFSFNSARLDTRFGSAVELMDNVRKICKREPVITVEEAEPLGPASPLEALIICPCTGNTLAKIANGITDTPVTMAAKAHLRADRPLLIALASNDAMSTNLANLSTLLNRKNIFFVPLLQDDHVRKPHSLVADFDQLCEAYDAMMKGAQLRPLFK